jgi:multidrug efflux pump subunit AcrA (membrane-fusion protein)
MKKKRLFWIPIVIVLLAAAGAGGYLYFKNKAASQATTTSAPLQTATVKKGNLIISASGIGTIIANQDVKDPNGSVTSLLSAQLSYLQAQKNYDSLVSSIPTDLANAELDLLTAQTTLTSAKSTRAFYDQARCSDDTTQSTKAAYENAQEQYNANPDSRNESTLVSARSSYYYCLSAWPQTTIDKADAAVKVDEQAVADLKATVESLSSGGNDKDLEIARDQLAIAKAQLQAKVPEALLKPSDEAVAATLENINTVLGIPNAITLLDDLNTPLLEVYIDEADLSSAVVGNEVTITFDSLPDSTFTGHIVYVYPSLTSVENTNVVQALVQIDPASYKVSQELPIKMSATVEIITAKAENVLLVPVEALRDLGSGKYSVFVVVNGELNLKTVEIGIQDITYAEVKSGLNEGDIVSTGIVETTK